MRCALILLLWLLPVTALACGRLSDCAVEGGSYRIVLPDGPVKGTLVVLHGWLGTARMLARSDNLARQANRRGLAMVYPDGRFQAWSVPNSPAEGARDDVGFLNAVKADLVARHGLDAAHMVLAGFSMGGQMTWTMACAHGREFAGFVAMSGAMWAPVPRDCADPGAIVIHIHGTEDHTVPLEGGAYGLHHRFASVESSLGLRLRSCGAPRRFKSGNMACKRWSCGQVTEFCRHGGGHVFYVQPLFEAWERVAILKGWQ